MNEKTKIEIWEKFKEAFVKEGIESPDQLVIQRTVPSEKELVKNRSVLKKIGYFGKVAVWIMKSAFLVGSVIVIYAELPEAIEKISTRHPQAYEVVHNVGEGIESYCSKIQSAKTHKEDRVNQYVGQYLVFNYGWKTDRTKFENDVRELNDTGRIVEGSILAPATGLDEAIVTQSDISVVPSDFTHS